MDAIRRGAMMKVGRMALGAIGAAGLAGRGANQGVAVEPSLQKAMYASEARFAGDAVGYNSRDTVSPDPHWRARNAATKPIYEKLQEMEKSRRWRVSEHAYLENLKSVSTHWKHSVMLDREKKRATAVETLQEQLRKLSEAPMEKLEQFANEALSAFMAELNKP